MAALSCCLLLVSVSVLFRHLTEAGPSVDLNRVLLAYNNEYDSCKDITDYSGHESKEAADEECELAFKALDNLKRNTCHGWRHAGCRVVSKGKPRQCTCKISHCDGLSVQSNKVRAFSDCAADLWIQELSTVETPAPTADFQERRSSYDDYWQAATHRRHVSSHSGHYSGAGISGGAYTLGGAGGSSGSSVSSSIYTFGQGYPAPIFPSYPVGASTSTVTADPDEETAEAQARPHTCDSCGGRFRSARAMFDHKRIYHQDGADTYCFMCNRSYINERGFLEHLKKQHPNLAAQEVASRKLSMDPAEAEAVMPLVCKFCPRRFSTQKGLRNHQVSHTTDETKCPACGKVLSTRGSMRIHIEKIHPGTPIPEPPRGVTIKEPETGPFECELCGNSYSRKNGLKDHMRSHKTRDTYCDECDRTFANKGSYRTHMKLAHPEHALAEKVAEKRKREEEKPEVCEECGHRSKNLRGLQEHKAVHRGKTKCHECNEVFARTSLLAEHKRKRHSSTQHSRT